MAITEELINFSLSCDRLAPPPEVLAIEKQSLIDQIGVDLASTGMGEGCASFIELAQLEFGRQECTVIGTGLKVSPVTAALVNGSFSHAMDFEDSCALVPLHSNATTIPALLALAQYVGNISGNDFLEAMAVGSEISIRTALAIDEDLSEHGWYMQPIFGAVGAVLAGSRLVGLDPQQTRDALSMVLFQVSGSGALVDSKDSVLRSVSNAFGAKAAVLSIILAKLGVRGRLDEPFEGTKGFFNAYAPGFHDENRMVNGLGEQWLCKNTTFKRWPTCHGTHNSIYATLQLMKENELTFTDIQSVHVKVSDFVKTIVLEPRDVKNHPDTAITAKFSLPITVGLAAKYGSVGLDSFIPERINDPDVQSLAERVTYEVNPLLTSKKQSRILDITFVTSKGTFERHVEDAPGDPKNPLSERDLDEKFLDCSSHSRAGYSTARCQEILNKLHDVDNLRDVREAIELL